MKQIPVIDVRKGSLADLLEAHYDRALKIIAASRGTFGWLSEAVSYVALPLGDRISRGWLVKSNNPYLAEIDRYQQILKAKGIEVKGIYALNMCYEWGCTSGVYAGEQSCALIRVLDWPFPQLGENIVIAHQSGSAGDFYNTTWPGVSGVFQAFAPGRFTAALNQAPMRRHKSGIFIDWARNRRLFHKKTGLPPAHLLRKVFETANSYQEAQRMLAEETVSIPVIYTLAGNGPEEGCVIERLEERAVIRMITGNNVNVSADVREDSSGSVKGSICAANHFESELNGIGYGWLPRAIDSYGRGKAGSSLRFADLDDAFKWFKAPIANPLSRLVMKAEVSSGKFSVMGTNGLSPVTEIFTL